MAVRLPTRNAPRAPLRGFVTVRPTLQVNGHGDVFAVGDVAATDPLRMSARNRGHVLAARNVRAHLGGTPLREYPPHLPLGLGARPAARRTRRVRADRPRRPGPRPGQRRPAPTTHHPPGDLQRGAKAAAVTVVPARVGSLPGWLRITTTTTTRAPSIRPHRRPQLSHRHRPYSERRETQHPSSSCGSSRAPVLPHRGAVRGVDGCPGGAVPAGRFS